MNSESRLVIMHSRLSTLAKFKSDFFFLEPIFIDDMHPILGLDQGCKLLV